jgi:hypothetical protein
VILLEIDAPYVAVCEFKSDAPRSVDMDRVPGRLKASQRMKIKAGNVHFLGPNDHIQAVEAAQDARMHLSVDLPGPPALPKLREALASEALYHEKAP